MQREPAEPGNVLPYATPRMARPFWVKLGLWGLPGRRSAWLFFWISMALAAFSVVYGFQDPRWFLGTMMLFAALWYWGSIRWVDHHDSWSPADVGRDQSNQTARS